MYLKLQTEGTLRLIDRLIDKIKVMFTVVVKYVKTWK